MLSFAVNNECNSRCAACNIWKNTDKGPSLELIANFCANPALATVEEISITGGEPFLRKDLKEISDIFFNSFSQLKTLSINTNGTMTSKLIDFIQHNMKRCREIYACVSFDAPNPESYILIRGIPAYHKALASLTEVASLGKIVIPVMSTTVVKTNITYLHELKNLADELKVKFTFRPAGESANYYNNRGLDTKLTLDQINQIFHFIESNDFNNNPYIEILKEFLKKGKLPYKCTAGKTFAFVYSDLSIHPCQYSDRRIFDFKEIADLGKSEKCDCCSECSVWPVITYDNPTFLKKS